MVSSLLLTLALFSWNMDPAPGPSVPFWWSAYPEADNTLLVNPAGSYWLNSSRMRVGGVFSDSTFEHFDRFTIEDKSGGFTGWWEDNQNLRRFTTSGSFQPFSSFSTGLSYTWYDPTQNNQPLSNENFFTLGINYRPKAHFGLGATFRSSVADLDACYITGIAIRPFGDETITLTGDYRFESGVITDRWSAGAEIRAIDGLTVRGAYGQDDTYTVGLQLDFGKASIVGGAELPDGDYSGTTTELILGDSPQPSIINPLPDFLSYKANNSNELPSKSFFGPRIPSFTETISILAQGADDDDVEGLLVDFSDYSLSRAQGEELRNVMVSYRQVGKPVYSYMEYGSNNSYYTASASEAICMHKAGQISINGFTGYTFFVRELLDKIGVYPDLMHIGKYKSASDMLTEYEISDAQAEATTALLETFKQELVRGISSGRGFEPAQMHFLFSNSPFAGRALTQTALIDTLMYHDEFEVFVEEEIGRSIVTMSPEYYSNIQRESSSWGSKPVVAVVVADGNIIGGHSGNSILGRTMGSETVIEMLEKAAAAEGVQSIVLRINSGGGEAMASADMFHAVENIRRNMPVVVSMGAVAASGGYYMACGADAIFADKMTVTGSIGIITGKFVFGGLLEMVGINVEKVEIDPSGSPSNPFEPYTEEQHERRFNAMREGYNLFVNTVADGRGMSFDEVNAIGQGRVWSGVDALELGLVDYNGGVIDAINHAAELARITDEDYQIKIFPTMDGFGTINMFPSLSASEFLQELSSDPIISCEGPLYLAPIVIVE